MSIVSSDIPNWSREVPRKLWDPSRRLLSVIRRYQRAGSSANGIVSSFLKKLYVLEYHFWSVVTGAEIDLNCQIGGGLLMPHPNGIVIHPKSVIGVNCLIFQQVTLAGEVHLGGHVDIGAGAKLLGPLIVGDHVRIGANSVVTANVANGATMVGIPARVLN